MALARVHTTAADGTFSAAGATAWNAAHGVTGATSGGIPYFSSATGEASSALLTSGSPVLGGGSGTAPYTDSGFTTSGTGTSLVATFGSGISVGSTVSLAVNGSGPANGVYNRYITTENFFSIYDTAAHALSPGATGRLFYLGTGTTAQISLASGYLVGWSSNAAGDSAQNIDTNLSRQGAGVLQVGTTGAGSTGSIRAKFQSSDGTAGVASFGPAGVTSITVKDGIITAIS